MEVRIVAEVFKRRAVVGVRVGRFGRGRLLHECVARSPSPGLVDEVISWCQGQGLTIYLDNSAVSLQPCCGCGECTPVPCPNCSPGSSNGRILASSASD